MRPLWRLHAALADLQDTLDANEVHDKARFDDLYNVLAELGQTLERVANSNDEIVARLDRQPSPFGSYTELGR